MNNISPLPSRIRWCGHLSKVQDADNRKLFNVDVTRSYIIFFPEPAHSNKPFIVVCLYLASENVRVRRHKLLAAPRRCVCFYPKIYLKRISMSLLHREGCSYLPDRFSTRTRCVEDSYHLFMSELTKMFVHKGLWLGLIL